MYFFGINVKIINVGRVITLDNKDEKEIKKVTRKKKENNENEIKEKLKIEENKPLEKEVFKETKKDVINKNSNKTIIIIVVTALITTADSLYFLQRSTPIWICDPSTS